MNDFFNSITFIIYVLSVISIIGITIFLCIRWKDSTLINTDIDMNIVVISIAGIILALISWLYFAGHLNTIVSFISIGAIIIFLLYIVYSKEN